MGVVGRVGLCIGLGGVLVLSVFAAGAPALAQSALLDVLSSHVTVTHPGDVASDVAVEQIIRSGDTVATDETGRALVTYPDGSTALLEEKSSLTIEFVQTSAGDYVVRMQQTLGRVWYAVTRAVALGSRYEVRSAGMASVIRAGSDSFITVLADGETSVVTLSGTVDTTAGGAAVSVPAGSSTTVEGPGATPLPLRTESLLARPATVPSGPNTPDPGTAAPTAQPTRTPTGTNVIVPPVATVPVVAVTTPRAITPALATPKPTAAPTPAASLREKLRVRTPTPTQSPSATDDEN